MLHRHPLVAAGYRLGIVSGMHDQENRHSQLLPQNRQCPDHSFNGPAFIFQVGIKKKAKMIYQKEPDPQTPLGIPDRLHHLGGRDVPVVVQDVQRQSPQNTQRICSFFSGHPGKIPAHLHPQQLLDCADGLLLK